MKIQLELTNTQASRLIRDLLVIAEQHNDWGEQNVTVEVLPVLKMILAQTGATRGQSKKLARIEREALDVLAEGGECEPETFDPELDEAA